MHGNPNKTKSASGISFSFIFSIGPSTIPCLKFSLYVIHAFLSKSFANTISTPARWNPRHIPPTPANRDIAVYFFVIGYSPTPYF